MYIRPDHLEKWSGHGRTGRIGRAAPVYYHFNHCQNEMLKSSPLFVPETEIYKKRFDFLFDFLMTSLVVWRFTSSRTK